jgi:hypothetical protein
VIKEIIKKKNVEINAIDFDNELVTDKQSVANKFND